MSKRNLTTAAIFAHLNNEGMQTAPATDIHDEIADLLSTGSDEEDSRMWERADRLALSYLKNHGT